MQFILVSCSLLATNATDQQCENLLHQCNQLKVQCIPSMLTLKSCCDLKNFPPSKAPSAVYQLVTNCSCQLSTFSTEAVDAYCDMDATDGGWMVVQRNKIDEVKPLIRGGRSLKKGLEILMATNCGMVSRY